MKQAEHVAGPDSSKIALLPLFESFIPVPVVTELAPREGWAAFTAAMRGRIPAPLTHEEGAVPQEGQYDRP